MPVDHCHMSKCYLKVLKYWPLKFSPKSQSSCTVAYNGWAIEAIHSECRHFFRTKSNKRCFGEWVLHHRHCLKLQVHGNNKSKLTFSKFYFFIFQCLHLVGLFPPPCPWNTMTQILDSSEVARVCTSLPLWSDETEAPGS